MSTLTAIIGWIVLVLAVEITLWSLFRHKAAQLNPGNESSSTLLSGTVMGALRIFTIVHALVLLLSVGISFWFLW